MPGRQRFFLQQPGKGGGGRWPGEEVALAEVAVQGLEYRQVTFGLDALGDGLDAQVAGQAEDGLHYLQAFRALVELGHEGAVDLQHIQVEAVQVAEGGIAGTEVVDADAHAQVVELLEHRGGSLGIGHGHAFGDLQAHALRTDAGFCNDAADLLHQVMLGELPGRQVDAHGQGRGAGMFAVPASHVAAGFVQYPEAEGQDQAGVLGHLDEVAGVDQFAGRLLPAHQRLHADYLLAGQPDYGLVVQDELAVAQGLAQLGLQRQPADGQVMHAVVEEFEAVLAQGLGAVHGQVRMAEDFFRRFVAQGAGGDADAGADVELLAIDQEGRFQGAHQALGDQRRGVGSIDAVQQDGEFIAAHPRQRVALPQAGAESRGDLDDEQVAGQVAQAVVDQLEAVEVDEQHREGRLPMAAAAGHGAGQAVGEERTVGQAGERIVEGVDQLLFGALAFHHPAHLHADLRHQVQQGIVRRQHVAGKELQDTDHFAANQHRERCRGLEAGLFRGGDAAEVRGLRDIGDPGWRCAGEHATGQAGTGAEFHGLGHLAEDREACLVGAVPDRRRAQARFAFDIDRQVGVADPPAGELTDAAHSETESIGDRGGAVGGVGYGLQQLELLLLFIELAQAALGDQLRLQPCLALTLEAAPQLVGFGISSLIVVHGRLSPTCRGR
ncbi:hypothetical protein D9M71_247390 [compost metagenome]